MTGKGSSGCGSFRKLISVVHHGEAPDPARNCVRAMGNEGQAGHWRLWECVSVPEQGNWRVESNQIMPPGAEFEEQGEMVSGDTDNEKINPSECC